MTVVVDASALVDFLTDGVYADLVDHRVQGERAVWAPHLIDAEVGHAVRAGVRRGAIGPAAAAAALADLADLRLLRAPHVDLLPGAWSMRHNLSFYEALYVALAAALDAPLITLDTRLAAAPGLPAPVECLVST